MLEREGPQLNSAMSNVCAQASEHVKMCMHLAGIYFYKFDSILSVSFQM